MAVYNFTVGNLTAYEPDFSLFKDSFTDTSVFGIEWLFAPIFMIIIMVIISRNPDNWKIMAFPILSILVALNLYVPAFMIIVAGIVFVISAFNLNVLTNMLSPLAQTPSGMSRRINQYRQERTERKALSKLGFFTNKQVKERAEQAYFNAEAKRRQEIIKTGMAGKALKLAKHQQRDKMALQVAKHKDEMEKFHEEQRKRKGIRDKEYIKKIGDDTHVGAFGAFFNWAGKDGPRGQRLGTGRTAQDYTQEAWESMGPRPFGNKRQKGPRRTEGYTNFFRRRDADENKYWNRYDSPDIFTKDISGGSSPWSGKGPERDKKRKDEWYNRRRI